MPSNDPHGRTSWFSPEWAEELRMAQARVAQFDAWPQRDLEAPQAQAAVQATSPLGPLPWPARAVAWVDGAMGRVRRLRRAAANLGALAAMWWPAAGVVITGPRWEPHDLWVGVYWRADIGHYEVVAQPGTHRHHYQPRFRVRMWCCPMPAVVWRVEWYGARYQVLRRSVRRDRAGR